MSKQKKKEHVGKRLREMRLAQDVVGQQEICESVQINQSYLSRIENEQASPSRDVLERLAYFWSLTLEDLVLGTTSEKVVTEGPSGEVCYCPNTDCPGAERFRLPGSGAIVIRTFFKTKLVRGRFLEVASKFCRHCGSQLCYECKCGMLLDSWTNHFCERCGERIYPNELTEHEWKRLLLVTHDTSSEDLQPSVPTVEVSSVLEVPELPMEKGTPQI